MLLGDRDLSKANPVESNAIRRSAKGERCTVNVAGVCNMDPETTVLAHFPSDIAGYKSTDLSAGYACSDCHDWIDRRRKNRDEDSDRQFYMRRSQTRTIHRLIEKGIVFFK